jgi:hypothetical protein
MWDIYSCTFAPVKRNSRRVHGRPSVSLRPQAGLLRTASKSKNHSLGGIPLTIATFREQRIGQLFPKSTRTTPGSSVSHVSTLAVAPIALRNSSVRLPSGFAAPDFPPFSIPSKVESQVFKYIFRTF